jgi:hypothetical protein
VQPKAEVMSPLRAPSIYPNTSVFFGTGPVYQARPPVYRFEAVLQSTLVTEFDLECFVVCVRSIVMLTPICRMDLC